MPSTLPDSFFRLSTIGKARVFARLIHAATVRARCLCPGEDAADGVRLRMHNEEVHRMSGRLMALLGDRVSAAQDDHIFGQIEFIAASSPRRREELERWIAEADRV